VTLITAIGLCAFLYCFALGDIAFLGKDEPKNAQAARGMLERGDWVVTMLEGEPWFDKPILYYWTAVVGYKLFGVSELGARLGPALAALLTLWFTAGLARRLLPDRPHAAALAVLVLGSSLEFFWLARSAVTDSLLACFVTGTLAAWWRARDSSRPLPWFVAAGAAAGMAALAKGPVGIALPGLVIATDLVLRRTLAPLRPGRIAAAAAAFLAVAGPWYTLVMLRSNGRFFDDFILHYNVERFTTENLPHPGPIYYYLPVLLLGPFPWSAFLPGAFVRVAREWRRLQAVERDRLRFLLLWIALPLVFFSFAGSKLPSYLLPTFPAIALLLAREIGCVVDDARLGRRRALAIAGSCFALVSAGIAAGTLYYLTEHDADLVLPAFPFSLVLAGAAIAALAGVGLRRPRLILGGIGAAAFLAPLAAVTWALPAAEDYASARHIAARAMAAAAPGAPILAYRFYDNSFFFYTNERTERWWERRWIEQKVEGLGEALCFVQSSDLPDLLASERVTSEPIATVAGVHLLRLRAVKPSPPAGPPAAGG
jgi:4-amino-4-deoxy-L-arabinose transferase-like glycosyltransferase